MPTALSRLTLLLSVGAFVACSKDAATDGAATGAAPATTEAPSVASGAEPTANDVSNYKLDMDKMRKYAAANRNLAAIAEKNPNEEEFAVMGDGNQSTAQTIARLESHPAAKRALSQAGLSAKDYVWITAAWLQAAMTDGILSTTPGAKIPEGQNMQNVDFLRANKAELETMMRSMGQTN